MPLTSTSHPHVLSFIILSLATCSLAQNAHSKVTLDPTYGTVASPKGNFPQDPNHIRVVCSILLPISLAFLGISVTESRRWNSTVPAALTVGAATCVLAEAINCYLSNVYWTYAHDHSQLMFTLLGREFDIYVGIIWWSFGAVLSCIIFGALMRNVRTGTLWILLGLAGFFDLVLEESMLQYGGIYTYYGHQPLVLFKLFPCWWLFCNVSGIFLGIAITYRYRAWFDGWRSLFLLPILPFCYVGPQVLAAMPTIYVVQANHTPIVTQLCGILTCCIAIIQTGVMMDVILGRDPLEFNGSARNKPFDKEEKAA
ncbi:hypothetical protein ACHAPJ_010683 [Fusarium lateritium]